MDEILTCTVLGINSVVLGDLQTNPTAREVWMGVRVRTANGRTRFLQGMLVEAEAAAIIKDAMRDGETVEMWLTGKPERAYPYAVRTVTDAWYYDGYSGYLIGQGVKMLIVAILTLPLIGLGVLFLPSAIGYFVSASTFSVRRYRTEFDRASAAGVPGIDEQTASGERLQAA